MAALGKLTPLPITHKHTLTLPSPPLTLHSCHPFFTQHGNRLNQMAALGKLISFSHTHRHTHTQSLHHTHRLDQMAALGKLTPEQFEQTMKAVEEEVGMCVCVCVCVRARARDCDCAC